MTDAKEKAENDALTKKEAFDKAYRALWTELGETARMKSTLHPTSIEEISPQEKVHRIRRILFEMKRLYADRRGSNCCWACARRCLKCLQLKVGVVSTAPDKQTGRHGKGWCYCLRPFVWSVVVTVVVVVLSFAVYGYNLVRDGRGADTQGVTVIHPGVDLESDFNGTALKLVNISNTEHFPVLDATTVSLTVTVMVMATLGVAFACCCCFFGRCCWSVKHGQLLLDAALFFEIALACYSRNVSTFNDCFYRSCCCKMCREDFARDNPHTHSTGHQLHFCKHDGSSDAVSSQVAQSASFGARASEFAFVVLAIPTSIAFSSLNYSYLVIDLGNGEASLVDPAVPELALKVLKRVGSLFKPENGWPFEKVRLRNILCTHKHHDHAAGNRPLAEKFPGLRVLGLDFVVDGVTELLKDGQSTQIGGATKVVAIATPGHCVDHVAFHLYPSTETADVGTAVSSEGKTDSMSDEKSSTADVGTAVSSEGKTDSMSEEKSSTADVGTAVSAEGKDDSTLEEKSSTESSPVPPSAPTEKMDISPRGVAKAGVVFTGDALFVGGIGGLFEGYAEECWSGLEKLKQLPPDTLMFPGHEYTMNFLSFALWLEPNNDTVASKVDWMLEQRFGSSTKRCTIPSSIKSECDTNPFMRSDSIAIAHRVGMCGGSNPAEALRRVRRLYARTHHLWSLQYDDVTEDTTGEFRRHETV